jgi:predicted RNase H-like HicB family nuclease
VSRVKFCGSLGGSVTVRKGETPEQALARAEDTILALFERGAKNLSDDGLGPNVCLELDEVAA